MVAAVPKKRNNPLCEMVVVLNQQVQPPLRDGCYCFKSTGTTPSMRWLLLSRINRYNPLYEMAVVLKNRYNPLYEMVVVVLENCYSVAQTPPL